MSLVLEKSIGDLCMILRKLPASCSFSEESEYINCLGADCCSLNRRPLSASLLIVRKCLPGKYFLVHLCSSTTLSKVLGGRIGNEYPFEIKDLFSSSSL